MSVDIGESLIQTWLRHVRGCDIVQTNWKAAMHIAYDINKAKKLLEEFYIEFPFFSKQDIQTKIRQTEIDALGCVLDEKKYFATDIAFHEDGLHYKEKDVVPSKILRTILCLYGYLGAKKATIVFATPYIKADSTNSEKIFYETFVKQINEFLKSHSDLKEYEVKLYTDIDFETKILNPVLYLVDKIKDTSEVFVRACQILICTRKAGSGETKNLLGAEEINGKANLINTSCGQIDVSELSTQQIIEQYILPKLRTEGKRALKNYFDQEWSSKNFRSTYAFLSTTQVYTNNHARYYSQPYYLDKSKEIVYITNNCSPAKLINWINKNGI